MPKTISGYFLDEMISQQQKCSIPPALQEKFLLLSVEELKHLTSIYLYILYILKDCSSTNTPAF